MEFSGGDLLVATNDTVVRIDPATGAQELDLPAIQGFGFGDLAHGSGTSYFVRQGPNVLRFEPAPGVGTGGLISAVSVQPPFSSSEAPRSVAVTPAGQVLVVVGQTLLQVDPETRAILVGPPSVADTAFPGALDVEADGDALTAHFDAILRVQDGIGGVEEFAVGNNLSSIRSIFRETSGRVLALEFDEIVRVFPEGPQSIVTRNQLFGSADVRDLAVVPGGDIFVSDGGSTNLIRISASNPDTNQSSLPEIGRAPYCANRVPDDPVRAVCPRLMRGGANSWQRRESSRKDPLGPLLTFTVTAPASLGTSLINAVMVAFSGDDTPSGDRWAAFQGSVDVVDVPELSTIALLGSGIVGLAAIGRRRA